MAKFLNVQFTDGKVYEQSKEPKEGFEEHVSTKGNKTYRKYYTKGIFGTLVSVEKRESPIGEQIQVTLKDKTGDYQNLQFSLYDTNGAVDNRFAESLLRVLPNLKKGENYRVYPYVMEAQGDYKYGSSGVSVHKANIEAETVNKEDKVEVFFRYLKKEETPTANDIPKLEFKEQRGKNRPTAVSIEAKTNFLYDVLEKYSIKGEGQQTSTPPTQTKTVDETKSFIPTDNSLPF